MSMDYGSHPHLPPAMAEMAVGCEAALEQALDWADQMRAQYRPGVAVPRALQHLRERIAQAYEDVQAINGSAE